MIYELRLTGEQLQIIADALAAMPYGRVSQVIGEIQKQIAAQNEQNKRQSGQAN